MSDAASRRAASADGFKEYVRFRGDKFTRNEGRSWNRGWKDAAAYFDTALARAVAEERTLLNEFMDATDRVMEIAGKLDSDLWYRLSRVRQKTSALIERAAAPAKETRNG